MPTLSLVHGCTILATIAGGVAIFRAGAGRPMVERLAAATLPFTAAVVAWLLFATLVIKPVIGTWSAARLVAAMAVANNLEIYYPAGRGPVIGWVYPPGSALAYLPAALVPDPGLATLAGRLLSLLYYYGPAAWLLVGGGGGRRGPGRWPLLVAFALLTYRSPALLYASTEVHADAPALGLAGLAVVLMARWGDSPRARAAALALGVFSVWTKQLTAPVPIVVLPLWALAKHGVRGLLQAAVTAALVAAGVAILVLIHFDGEGLLFNSIRLLSTYPYRISGFRHLAWVFIKLEHEHLLLIVLAAVGFLGTATLRPGPAAPAAGRGGRADLRGLTLAVALAELPFALMGYCKFGGDVNSLAFCLYFLVLGSLLMFEGLDPAGPEDGGRGAVRWPLLVIVALNLTLALLEDQTLALDLSRPQRTWDEGRAAARYIRAHRGEAYFPWHPLEHLMVEGRLYHFEDGVDVRRRAGFPLTTAHYLRHIPPRTRIVCFPAATYVAESPAGHYLGAGWRWVDVAELPGWNCYEIRPPAPPGGAGHPAPAS